LAKTPPEKTTLVTSNQIIDLGFLSNRARQANPAIPLFDQSLLGVVINTARIVNALKTGDKERRQAFTQRLARDAFAIANGNAVIVCNTFFETTGSVLSRSTQRYDAALGADVTFEVVVLGRGGTFNRIGDGGFENVS
jgi:hypothetical protein